MRFGKQISKAEASREQEKGSLRSGSELLVFLKCGTRDGMFSEQGLLISGGSSQSSTKKKKSKSQDQLIKYSGLASY